jgi:hypothetical protein
MLDNAWRLYGGSARVAAQSSHPSSQTSRQPLHDLLATIACLFLLSYPMYLLRLLFPFFQHCLASFCLLSHAFPFPSHRRFDMTQEDYYFPATQPRLRTPMRHWEPSYRPWDPYTGDQPLWAAGLAFGDRASISMSLLPRAYSNDRLLLVMRLPDYYDRRWRMGPMSGAQR